MGKPVTQCAASLSSSPTFSGSSAPFSALQWNVHQIREGKGREVKENEQYSQWLSYTEWCMQHRQNFTFRKFISSSYIIFQNTVKLSNVHQHFLKLKVFQWIKEFKIDFVSSRFFFQTFRFSILAFTPATLFRCKMCIFEYGRSEHRLEHFLPRDWKTM